MFVCLFLLCFVFGACVDTVVVIFCKEEDKIVSISAAM